ncbi:hypothetical protein A1F97_00026 [Pyrenophora tritici-repentis]|nr:hypothetical protein A1F97_00026 [Pyrenophora tritici-repentis]
MTLSSGALVATICAVIALLGALISAVVVVNRRRRDNIRTIGLQRLNPTTLPPPILAVGGRQPGLVHQAPPQQHIRFASTQYPRQAAGGAPSSGNGRKIAGRPPHH